MRTGKRRHADKGQRNGRKTGGETTKKKKGTRQGCWKTRRTETNLPRIRTGIRCVGTRHFGIMQRSSFSGPYSYAIGIVVRI